MSVLGPHWVTSLDDDDPAYVAGYLLGVISEAVRRDRWISAVVPARCAEMIMRIAEAERLPFCSRELGDDALEIAIGDTPQVIR